ncbi:DeoR family glycerol-3-phosphate regulon repressor [Thalassospira sp. MBR-102]|jgi:DeoR family glycerol-3-phosphate regulon repressor|uniref:DeoR family transcriptional regulator n=3 Tax=Thalassospira TaxID=168934 RepID=A0ABR5Y2J7_9PROT|nr:MULTISPECIES: DeoR/GlpR family DNA-binding transcription regulator [Thalassospira]MBR9780116.1 DeoR/GlpR transcriptional regulator [Rhodospirillales bacterium]AJD50968.1 DNA-binding transcriptional repressor [Thalassospira xiamenensis M-5 = DSM 17429]KEO56691.1 transcriptional regulator [Thalassospira permensis NBRC 106175]KZD04592.1 DeoR family transcriptional regulator [Thalassospira xiamenensis]KZD10398.1 DeoR family transcriptional regulator [Thalassospira xiamenensis]|tara:strand:- start:12822 stop:13607 length:786 start_codon:yes stop_codon:yes gene_type:complete
MNISIRQRHIIDILRRDGFASIDALADQFEVTPQTVRRDVNILSDANLVRRRHGGAEYAGEPGMNLSYDNRQVTNIAAKHAISLHVAGKIPDGASILIGIGSTLELLALNLADHRNLTVITNNLNVAMALGTNTSNRIVIPGGTVRLPDRDLITPDAEEMFHNYKADFGIFGVGGIETDGTLTDFDHREVALRQAIIGNCRNSILVADQSKFGRPAPAKGGHLTDPDMIVIDQKPGGDFNALFQRQDILDRLQIAKGETLK